MNEDYVSYEQSQKLKKLGFDWEVNQYYLINAIGDIILWFPEEAGGCDFNFFDDGRFSAPTLSQAAKCLREKGIGITVQIYTKEKRDWGPNYFEGVFYRPFFTSTKDAHAMGIINNNFNSYEEALRAGIDGALKILMDNRL